MLVYNNHVEHIKLWDEKEGPVANLQSKLSDVRPNGEVYNKAGAKIAIVHQYDRYPHLQKYLFTKVMTSMSVHDALLIVAI